jgi:hypothetical protein
MRRIDIGIVSGARFAILLFLPAARYKLEDLANPSQMSILDDHVGWQTCDRQHPDAQSCRSPAVENDLA